ncbi:MAG: hypothetical protein WAP03_07185 [Methylorubrum rhodinum]|uniref:hypothetical protein n=1 Tax=Methylorubrum rhodinum TaxID=29428 RepID=UPI003BAE75E4
MSEGIEAALATLEAELSATQQIVKLLLVQHSLDRSRTEPTRTIDDLGRDFSRILAELSRGAGSTAERQHFAMVTEALEAQLDSARQLARSFAVRDPEE